MARPTCACGECRKCKHREYMKEWYRTPGAAERVRSWAKRYRRQNFDKVREYDNARPRRAGEPEKTRARAVVNHALVRGELHRKPCEVCGIPDQRGIDGRSLIQAHHDDYSKPLEVRWLCSTCHGIEHRKVA